MAIPVAVTACGAVRDVALLTPKLSHGRGGNVAPVVCQSAADKKTIDFIFGKSLMKVENLPAWRWGAAIEVHSVFHGMGRHAATESLQIGKWAVGFRRAMLGGRFACVEYELDLLTARR